MGLNVKEILLRLCKMVQVSAKSSYTFLQRHPVVSGALLVFFISYLFLSYIYSFLAYLSPFLVCAAIFGRIFWSSEKTELKYVKKKEENGEQKTVGPKYSNIPNSGRHDLLDKYPSQNATSRRRNFRGKKWDVYGGLEEKVKDLSTVFHNEFTKRNNKNKEGKYFEKGESSMDYDLPTRKSKAPRRQTIRFEPSMIDLVEMDNEKIEDVEDEEDEDVRSEEAQEDRNKAIEWNANDQKNLMVVGISEIERNKRLETLIARRRARKLKRVQHENGLIDKKSIAPSHIAPILIEGSNPLDSKNDFEGLEIPCSAPSIMPSTPYDIPFDNSEERPYLIGDSFDQEFIVKEKDIAFCRHESFSLGPNFPSESKEIHGAKDHNYILHNRRKYSDRLAYPRFKWISDKGDHDWLIDQLLYTEGSESGFQTYNASREGEETTHQEDEQRKIDASEMKDVKTESAHETKSMSGHTSEPNLFPNIPNVQTSRVSDNSRLRFHVPHQRLLKFPSSTSTTITEEHIPSPFDKKHDLFSNDRRICHTPTYSIASDLQVEVSEVGSPASTVEETAETNSTSERDSVLYDGDIDRDISSGSEDLWGASFHGRGETQGVSTEDIAKGNNSFKEITSPISLRQIDEENAADVSSFSSRCDMPDDTPTCAINSDHNIFGDMKNYVKEAEASQSSKCPQVSSPQKNLMDCSLDDLPSETHTKKHESIMPENFINEVEIINEVNNPESTNQDNTQNSSLVPQESIDEASTSSVASSPRSVLPDALSPVYNQRVHIGTEQSNVEDMTQETFNDERSPDTVPQNIHALMDDTTFESHNIDFDPSRVQTNPSEDSIEESNIFSNMNHSNANNKEEHDRLKNEEHSEDTTHQIREETHVQPTRLVEDTTAENMDENSRELVGDKVIFDSFC
ncbi:PREDICTED: uncharacterized protein LOC109327650 [Lupinus angustifolius]|uniref:uncharacterized protein LOC109327650 n=1 Tax=Lupinus angustifolius TaxID=3871 RepID=UPI00092EA916|nr:PREDICTED: uncharacterized protein LOC109327650 [Lupinus angustifolius]